MTQLDVLPQRELKELPILLEHKRARTRVVVVVGFFLAGFMAFGIYWAPTIRTAVGGLPVLNGTEFAGRYNSKPTRELVDLTVDGVVDSGYVWQSTSGTSFRPKSEVKARFMLAAIGDRLLVIKTLRPTNARRYRGMVTGFPVTLSDKFDSDLTGRLSLRQAVVPLVLDATLDYRLRTLLFFSGGLIVAAGLAELIRRNLVGQRSFVKLPMVKRLGARSADAKAVLNAAQAEWVHPIFRLGAARFTENFIVDDKRFVAPMADVVSLRLGELPRRHLRFLPSNVVVVAQTTEGMRFRIKVPSQLSPTALSDLQAAYPHVVVTSA